MPNAEQMISGLATTVARLGLTVDSLEQQLGEARQANELLEAQLASARKTIAERVRADEAEKSATPLELVDD